MSQNSSNLSRVMDADTISKNGAISKSLMRRNKLFVFGLIVLIIISFSILPWARFRTGLTVNFSRYLDLAVNDTFYEPRLTTFLLFMMGCFIMMLVNLVACLFKSRKFFWISTLLTGIFTFGLALIAIGVGTKLIGFYLTMLCGIALLVIAYKGLFSGKINKPKVKNTKANSYSKSALETLTNRYASGEISKEEYEQIKRDIS